VNQSFSPHQEFEDVARATITDAEDEVDPA
jgi:hypothetical protein